MKASELARVLGAELAGDPDVEVTSARGVSDLQNGCLTFLAGTRHAREVLESQAAAVLVDRFVDELAKKTQLRVPNPYLAFAKALAILSPAAAMPRGVMPGALIEEGVILGQNVTVFPQAYLSRGSSIGDGTVVYPFVFIGAETTVGSNCIIYPNVVIRENISIGNRVVIHPNAVVGADGFGYVFDGGLHHKIPQVGSVVIGDDVEVGAGVTIDRGTTGATTIGEGTKIDNLVQIGHNVKIGRHCIIVAQVGIGGSSVIGDYVTLAGQVGVADHCTIESGTMVGAQSGLMGEVAKGKYLGSPALPHKKWFRVKALMDRLPDLMERLKQLEERVKNMEEKRDD
ncbi:MAG: UDP-3-O-(3-hydroxymyristoyl)glucosamine N-acyltransferase [Thermodesulfovibrionales bacterium]